MEKPVVVSVEVPEAVPQPKETFLDRLKRDLRDIAEGKFRAGTAMHPIFNRILATELTDLLEEFKSGFLSRHDDKTWGGNPPGRGGYSASLFSVVTVDHIETVLMHMELMSPKPRGAVIKGWWLHALEVALGWRAADAEVCWTEPDPVTPGEWRFVFGQLPTPTHAEMLEAATVFAIRLFKEVFPYGEQDQRGAQAA